MELAQITAGQVVMLFLLMGTGIAAVKTGVLKPVPLLKTVSLRFLTPNPSKLPLVKPSS